MKSSIIISERSRPFWQIPIAALCFTISVYLIYMMIFHSEWTGKNKRILFDEYASIISLIVLGVGFCNQKRVYIDLKNSRFRPTVEIGNFKYGKWKTIKNYEYVSVFQQLLQDGTTTFEVNIWFDTNKHYQLYERNNYLDAFSVGYNLSEELDVDLLDATVPNDFKWVDKNDWKQQMINNASE